MRAYRGHHYALNEPVEAPRRRSLRSLGSEREPATLSYGGATIADQPPTRLQIGGATAGSAQLAPLAPRACPTRSHHRRGGHPAHPTAAFAA